MFTRKEIEEKYGFQDGKGKPDFVKYMSLRGVILIKNNTSHRCYDIVDDSLFNLKWVNCVGEPELEICKEGYIRNKSTKKILNSLTTDGYVMYKRPDGSHIVVHKLMMNTFKPIQNAELCYIDHIDGRRNNNHINNLRWVTPQENALYKMENWELFRENFNALLQKIGYEEMNRLFEEELSKK